MQVAPENGKSGTRTSRPWRRPGFSLIAPLTLAFLLCSGAQAPARADSGPALKILRDAEIETDIHVMMTAIWKAAGLDPGNVHVYLVEDPQINSFVAGGPNIFINTGLLFHADTPDQLIGVLAHETGHIAEGHLTRAEGAMEKASIAGMIATALGAAAAVMSHSDQSGAALLPGPLVGERIFAHYRVSQEASADAAALSYLDQTHQSGRGLLQFFEKLQSDEMLSGDSGIPYLRDHPLTQSRIERVRDHLAHSPYANAPDPPRDGAMLKRMKVKLRAFLSSPAETLGAYPETDRSLLARYARAIAYYRIPQLERALSTIDALIREYPKDPYFAELKGQMLFENGHIKEAAAPYDDAVRLAPSSPLLRIERAEVDIATGDKALNKRAVGDLTDALLSEPFNSDGWHFLAIAYGREGRIGMAALSLAEQGLASGKKKDALLEANRAEHLLPKDSAASARAKEIAREAKEL
jgi:predicted Zn-dependent protease